jgi:hypothetical protein
MPKVMHMNRRPRTLRIVALLAAYVVGLQALLLPLSVAAGGALGFTICSSVASVGSPQAPAGHDTGCPCAAGCGMQCGIHALAPPPQVAIADLARDADVAAASPLRTGVIHRPVIRGPQLPRPPPFV